MQQISSLSSSATNAKVLPFSSSSTLESFFLAGCPSVMSSLASDILSMVVLLSDGNSACKGSLGRDVSSNDGVAAAGDFVVFGCGDKSGEASAVVLLCGGLGAVVCGG